MSNPAVDTTLAPPSPTDDPLNITQLFSLIDANLSSAIQGSYTPYVISSITPSVEDQDKAWLQLDGVGRPIAMKIFYNGQWRRFYNGMIGEVRGYTGDPSIDFDSNGLGLVGERYDGWHIMNGLDGTPDWSDKFVIGGHMNNASGHNGYSGGWQTFVNTLADLKTGGAATIQLDATNTYIPPRDAVTAQRFQADGNAPDAAGDLLATGGGGTRYTLSGGDPFAGNPTPPAINVLNPFVAAAWIIFVGYA